MCKPKKVVIPNAGNADAIKALKIAYDEKVKPTEIRHLYASFDTPPIRDPELFGKPTVMLLGQYSVGKTSMISYLLNGTYPGADIGPEPTTDIDGNKEQCT
ncbi:EH domain-containing protein 4 [Toxocara canis]|uniref:EH domain-containing protein 4 n=1 Tax=Toxocara canis TaxID=6265 RepID=A0A0B2UV73_TOXCA|nr:EH domain-containing protein 4 [Toxocara canis]